MIASEEKTFHVPDRQYRLASTGEEGLFDFLEDDPPPVGVIVLSVQIGALREKSSFKNNHL